MAEFVIAFPVFLVILVSVIDLGVNFGDGIQLSQGSSEAIELAARSQVGTRTHCDVASDVLLAPLTRRVICTTKAKTHLDPATVRVKVFYETTAGAPLSDYQPTEAGHATDAIMVMCVMSPENSATGLLSAVFHQRVHTARHTAKLGVPAKGSGGQYAPAASERPLEGQNWSFCTADDPGATT
jgi:hypothetical protein